MVRRAFTLIELLVVVAILAILAALLFPVFTRAKAAAKQATCIGNLKQVGSAFMLYMADYDDIFPRGLDPVDKNRPQIWNAYPQWQAEIPYMPYLHDVLQPYLKSREIFHCPADSGTYCIDNNWPLELPTSPSLFQVYGTSYFYRTEIAFRMMSQTQFGDLTKINVLFDAAGDWHPNVARLEPRDSWRTVYEKLRMYRYNVLFADMHVKNVTYGNMQYSWSQGL